MKQTRQLLNKPELHMDEPIILIQNFYKYKIHVQMNKSNATL